MTRIKIIALKEHKTACKTRLVRRIPFGRKLLDVAIGKSSSRPVPI
jgi:hypothetical protein